MRISAFLAIVLLKELKKWPLCFILVNLLDYKSRED